MEKVLGEVGAFPGAVKESGRRPGEGGEKEVEKKKNKEYPRKE